MEKKIKKHSDQAIIYTKNIWERYKKLDKPKQLVVTITAVIVLWMASGIFSSHKALEDDSVHGSKFAYKIERSVVTPYTRSLYISGKTESEKQLTLKSEIDGKVIKILAKEGDFLKAGEGIVQIEANEKQEDLLRSKANLEQRQIEYNSASALYKKSLSSEAAISMANAALKAAKADYKRAQVAMSNTIVKAPFDGHIDKISVQIGDLLQALQGSSQIGTFITNHAVIAVGYVPEQHIRYVNVGHDAEIITLSGQTFHGKVKFISKVASSTSRTFRVDVLLDAFPDEIVGETVKLVIPQQEVQAHILPISVLSLNTEGELGVKIKKDGKIALIPAELLGEENGKVMIRTAENEMDVVTLGHAYLLDGDVIQ